VLISSEILAKRVEIEAQRSLGILGLETAAMRPSEQYAIKQQERNLKMDSQLRKLGGLASAFILAGALAGCATYGRCGVEGCAGDATTTANVKSLFDQHPELGAPGSIDVQTVDHVVYLNGFVASGLERSTAVSLAQGTPGVTKVVNTLAVDR
jgi:osmotically-inducible protein OsmY